MNILSLIPLWCQLGSRESILMSVLRCMLHYRGFKSTRGRLGGREVLGVSRGCRPRRFSDIAVGTGCVVSPCACVIVYDTVHIHFFQLVLWVNKMFPERTPGLDGGSDAHLSKMACQGLSNSGVVCSIAYLSLFCLSLSHYRLMKSSWNTEKNLPSISLFLFPRCTTSQTI